MPFRSKAQQKFAYANPNKFGGKEGLAEWSGDTDFKSLPKRVKKFTHASPKKVTNGK